MDKEITHGSLFSGIGGFDLAASWLGWTNVFQVEKDRFCQEVLAKHFPDTKRFGDIHEFDGTPYRGAIDVLSGGFPCQPFSTAGKRRGKQDDRYLWPEYLRVIREVRPRWVLGENVAGIVNMALDQVISDLENEGYEVRAFIIPACAVNAPHRRDRVWIVAKSTAARLQRRIQRSGSVRQKNQIWKADNAQRSNSTTSNNESAVNGRYNREPEERQEPKSGESAGRSTPSHANRIDGDHAGPRPSEIPQLEATEVLGRDVTDADSEGRIGRSGRGDSNGNGIHASVQERQDSRGATTRRNEDASDPKNPGLEGRDTERSGRAGRRLTEYPLSRFWDNEGRPNWDIPWIEVATELCGISHGIPRQLDRVNRLKALGNAIVPQVAFEIFKAIETVNSEKSQEGEL